jgi:hypothetical protein
MNPLHECDEIVGARSAALGQAKKRGTASVEDADQVKMQRRNLLAQLDGLRNEFWTMPLDTLQAKLSELNARGYADLDAAVARLRIVAAHRAEFPKLAEKRGFDGDFFSSLKQVLTKSPRDVAVLKEQVLSTFRNRAHRKRGRQMLKLVKRELPAIYALEADWFDALYRQRVKGTLLVSSSRQGSAPAAMSGGSDFRKYWWVVWLFVVAVGRFFTTASSDNHHPTNNPPLRLPSHLEPLPEVPPSYTPSGPADRHYKIGNGQSGQTFGNDKHVWEPYPQPYAPKPTEQPGSRAPNGLESQFARPKIFTPSGRMNQPNDRYSR